jgi:hypothetical protein
MEIFQLGRNKTGCSFLRAKCFKVNTFLKAKVRKEKFKWKTREIGFLAGKNCVKNKGTN